MPKRSAAQRGRWSRNKGKRWEQEVARRMREAMPDSNARRGWQARDGGETADVIHPCFSVECKAGASPPMRQAMRQARECADAGQWPIAVLKRDKEAPVVVMDFEDWLSFAGNHWRWSTR